MAVEASLVTGLILHFRTPEQTLACLRSLRNEGIRHAVVIDNSEDEGHSVIRMRLGLDELLGAGLDVVFVTPERNLGFARAVAVGFRHIASTFGGPALLINSDARLERNALLAMVTQLDSAALVVPAVKDREDSAPRPSIGFYHALLGLILRHPIWGATSYPSGCCLLVREDEVRPDLFDTDFFFYGEDEMLGFELRRRSIGIVDCPEAVVVHTGSASSKNGSMFYEYHMNRAHWLLACKLSSNIFERSVFVFIRCITLPMRAVVRSVRFRSLAPWRGLFAATLDVLHGRCRSYTPRL